MDPLTRKLIQTVRQITEDTAKSTSGFVKTLPPIQGKPEVTQTLHTHNDKHYVVSTNSKSQETLVFPANQNGKITSMIEVWGSTPHIGDKGFNITDHHTATFQEFIHSK